jgi:hypothetical protein
VIFCPPPPAFSYHSVVWRNGFFGFLGIMFFTREFSGKENITEKVLVVVVIIETLLGGFL